MGVISLCIDPLAEAAHRGNPGVPLFPVPETGGRILHTPWVLMTPQVHSLHHSIDRTLSDSNYVNVFPL